VAQAVLESLGNLGSLGIALKELKIKNFKRTSNALNDPNDSKIVAP